MVKHLSKMWETWVRSLGQEDPLEKGMATYSDILAWRILWTVEHSGLWSMGSKRIRHTWATNSASKLLQSCPTLCDPIDDSPPGSAIPGDSPDKNTGVGCHFFLQCMKVKSESEGAQSWPTLCNPMYCSPPCSSIHGIFPARVPEWGAIAFSATNTKKVKILSGQLASWLWENKHHYLNPLNILGKSRTWC